MPKNHKNGQNHLEKYPKSPNTQENRIKFDYFNADYTPNLAKTLKNLPNPPNPPPQSQKLAKNHRKAAPPRKNSAFLPRTRPSPLLETEISAIVQYLDSKKLKKPKNAEISHKNAEILPKIDFSDGSECPTPILTTPKPAK